MQICDDFGQYKESFQIFGLFGLFSKRFEMILLEQS